MFFVVMDWFEDGVDSYRGMKVIPILDDDADIALFLRMTLHTIWTLGKSTRNRTMYMYSIVTTVSSMKKITLYVLT